MYRKSNDRLQSMQCVTKEAWSISVMSVSVCDVFRKLKSMKWWHSGGVSEVSGIIGCEINASKMIVIPSQYKGIKWCIYTTMKYTSSGFILLFTDVCFSSPQDLPTVCNLPVLTSIQCILWQGRKPRLSSAGAHKITFFIPLYNTWSHGTFKGEELWQWGGKNKHKCMTSWYKF